MLTDSVRMAKNCQVLTQSLSGLPRTRRILRLHPLPGEGAEMSRGVCGEERVGVVGGSREHELRGAKSTGLLPLFLTPFFFFVGFKCF